jgi:hypothetical protein
MYEGVNKPYVDVGKKVVIVIEFTLEPRRPKGERRREESRSKFGFELDALK